MHGRIDLSGEKMTLKMDGIVHFVSFVIKIKALLECLK